MRISVFLVALLQSAEVQTVPPELKAARAAREFVNAQIDFEVIPGPTIEKPERQTYQCRSTYTRGEQAYELHGHHLPSLGTPIDAARDHAITRGVHVEGRLFFNMGNSLSAHVWENPPGPVGGPMDVRVVGMHPRRSTAPTFDPFAPLISPTPAYDVSREGDLVVLSCLETTEDKSFERKWWLDPRRGWNVVRYEGGKNGTVSWIVVSELARYGEVWFPQTVEHFTADGRLRHTVRIRDFKANDPKLPRRLTPAFIGVDAGTSITHHLADGSIDQTKFFDGERVISGEEYKRRRRAGLLKRGPAYLEDREKQRKWYALRQTTVRYTPSKWEQYVGSFITGNRLDDGQATRAWTIYRDCKEQAERYLNTHKDEFERLEKEQASLRKNSEETKASGLRERLARLRQPVEKIFESRLLPRLESLLTREQLRLARETQRRVDRATSRPTKDDDE